MTQAGWRFAAPDGFDDLDWSEANDRDALLGGHLVYGERKFPVTLYGQGRLGQDAYEETKDGGLFYEPNVIAVAELTREAVEAAVSRLGGAGFFDWLLG